MLKYVITTHAHMPGVGLRRCGDWGGIRFTDDASAEAFARSDAKGKPFTIERQKVSLKLGAMGRSLPDR
jgi:hypothetical protein